MRFGLLRAAGAARGDLQIWGSNEALVRRKFLRRAVYVVVSLTGVVATLCAVKMYILVSVLNAAKPSIVLSAGFNTDPLPSSFSVPVQITYADLSLLINSKLDRVVDREIPYPVPGFEHE